MYRNEDKSIIANRWESWANLFYFGSLGLLFAFIFILGKLPEEVARVFVWYGAGFLLVIVTMGFFLGRKALKYRMSYLHAERERVTALLDEAIEAEKRKRT